jgi:hypothetical protein
MSDWRWSFRVEYGDCKFLRNFVNHYKPTWLITQKTAIQLHKLAYKVGGLREIYMHQLLFTKINLVASVV